MEAAWIFPDNSIKYLGNNFLHYQYLCLLYNDEEFKNDVYYNDYNLTFLKKYIDKGYIRLLCEPNTIGLMFSNNSKYSDSIIKATNNLIKNDTIYLTNNSPIKFIIENIDTNEYEVLEEYSDSLGIMKFNKLIKEKMKR